MKLRPEEQVIVPILEDLLGKPAASVTLLAKLLYTVYAGSLSTLQKLLKKHRRSLTAEVISDVRKIFTGAQETDTGLIDAAGFLGIYLSSLLDMKAETLQFTLDIALRFYARANTAEAYDVARDFAHGAITHALPLQALESAFAGAFLAADSAFFASQAVQSEEAEERYLLAALDDLVIATQWIEPARHTIWFQRFMSLLNGILERTNPLFLDELDPRFNDLLGYLSVATKQLIPTDFAFPDDPSNSIVLAANLANLAYRYNDATTARARLDFALNYSNSLVHPLLWGSIAYLCYLGAREFSHTSTSEWVALREVVFNKIEAENAKTHSSVGRIWMMQLFKELLESFLVEELNREKIMQSGLIEIKEGSEPELLSSSEPLQALDDFVQSVYGYVLDYDKTFYAIESLKARNLLDQLSILYHDFPTSELAKQVSQLEKKVLRFDPEDQEFNNLRFSEMRLASPLPIRFIEGYMDSSFEEHEALFAQHQEQITSIEQFYATYGAGFSGRARPADLAVIKQMLQPGEMLIEYFSPYVHTSPILELWIIAVTREDTRFIHVPLQDFVEDMGFWGSIAVDEKQPIYFGPLNQFVSELRIAIQQKDDTTARQYLELLYHILIAPLVERDLRPQDFRQWIIVPHAMLHPVPFAALVNPQGGYLIEDVALTVVSSSAVWHKLRTRSTSSLTSFLGLANPHPLPDGLPPLPFAEKELARICKSLAMLECSLFQREEATMSALQSHIGQKSIVHIATHGEFPELDVQDFHKLLLAPTANHDGYVNAKDFRLMDLHAAHLVTLSVCNGGVYRIGPGDEPYGLIASLLVAGTENIVSTLWPLDDEIGSFFMIDFYKRILQHGIAEALRQTCRVFIEDHASLKDWASFVLVGSGRSHV